MHWRHALCHALKHEKWVIGRDSGPPPCQPPACVGRTALYPVEIAAPAEQRRACLMLLPVSGEAGGDAEMPAAVASEDQVEGGAAAAEVPSVEAEPMAVEEAPAAPLEAPAPVPAMVCVVRQTPQWSPNRGRLSCPNT